jgi:hypothetical protein
MLNSAQFCSILLNSAQFCLMVYLMVCLILLHVLLNATLAAALAGFDHIYCDPQRFGVLFTISN